jgi:hypothetical protein
LKPNFVQRSTRLKLYKTLVLPTLLYYKNRLQTAEIKYLRRTVGYSLDHRRNEKVLEEQLATILEEKICTYRHDWFQHVHRMKDYRLPEQLLNYNPKGRRRPGRPLN